jgi:DNA-binding transcriptional MerR regulator
VSAPALSIVEKSPEAFRTISEVAIELDVPQHVLRFWESRFTQIKPVKRAGGRRYYRPEDVDLLRGIRALLYSDGLTIRGVQKVLKDRGMRHVAMVGRGDAPAVFAAPERVVVEKLVFVEKPAAKKRPTHLRAVPDAMSLPFFEEQAFEEPAFVEQPMVRRDDALARQERVKLECLLDELLGLKARLATARA